ncbi:MAG TPA: hypothetical protein ENH59_03070 [Bacteroidetes bacterium]|nr:hypothetical protein [Bacteroidota bacterium]
MGKNVGVWLDKEKAYVISVNGGKHRIEKVESNVESRVRYQGETKSYSRIGGAFFNPSKKKTKREKHQLNHYLTDLSVKLSDAENILIFGPADVKKELRKVLIKRKDKPAIRLEPAEQMTENQMVARVKEHFE